MKGSRWFIIGIIAFLILMFAVEYHLPKKFVWIPTFSHNDSQPFGCAVFDSVLSTSLPKGYALSKKSLYQLEQEDSSQVRGILVVSNDLMLPRVDVESILKLAERGNKIMLVSTRFGSILQDTLEFYCTYSYFNANTLKKRVSSLALERDTIYWVGDSVYSSNLYRFYPQFIASHFLRTDSLPQRKLVEKDLMKQTTYEITDSDTAKIHNAYHPLLAFSRPWGKGEVILVSTPLLFTNYGMLDGNNATYLYRLLSQMGDLPIIRTEGYMKESAQAELSPFRYLLSQPPLRWALYLTMLAILLFMLFTARRTQRVIPVMREPENKSLEFTELIGTLYAQKKDSADLVRKKYIYFSEELRRDIQVDLDEVIDEERQVRRIAQKTGMDVDELCRFFRELRPVLDNEKIIISDVEMKRYIDKMNEIVKQI